MTYCLINKANGGFSNCLIVLTSKANFFFYWIPILKVVEYIIFHLMSVLPLVS